VTIDKCREVLDRYEREIPDAVKRLRRQHDPALEHLLTMIPKMRTMLDEIGATGNQYAAVNVERTEKFMRWLGFMQGVLYSEGLFTVLEMRDHNRPTISLGQDWVTRMTSEDDEP